MEPTDEDFEIENFYRKYKDSDIQESEMRAVFGLAGQVHFEEIFEAKEADDETNYIRGIIGRIIDAGITQEEFIALMIYIGASVDYIIRNVPQSPLDEALEGEANA